jgi:hypothetical protein
MGDDRDCWPNENQLTKQYCNRRPTHFCDVIGVFFKSVYKMNKLI